MCSAPHNTLEYASTRSQPSLAFRCLRCANAIISLWPILWIALVHGPYLWHRLRFGEWPQFWQSTPDGSIWSAFEAAIVLLTAGGFVVMLAHWIVLMLVVSGELIDHQYRRAAVAGCAFIPWILIVPILCFDPLGAVQYWWD